MQKHEKLMSFCNSWVVLSTDEYVNCEWKTSEKFIFILQPVCIHLNRIHMLFWQVSLHTMWIYTSPSCLPLTVINLIGRQQVNLPVSKINSEIACCWSKGRPVRGAFSVRGEFSLLASTASQLEQLWALHLSPSVLATQHWIKYR